MRDARLPSHYIYNEHNRRLLIESGIMTANETWEEYRRMILRTILRPNKEVRNVIREMKSIVHQRLFSIGVHIRTGGLLANDCEGISMIDNKTGNRSQSNRCSSRKTHGESQECDSVRFERFGQGNRLFEEASPSRLSDRHFHSVCKRTHNELQDIHRQGEGGIIGCVCAGRL